jgi:hypothetical protein
VLSFVSLNSGTIYVQTNDISDIGLSEIGVSATILPYSATASR